MRSAYGWSSILAVLIALALHAPAQARPAQDWPTLSPGSVAEATKASPRIFRVMITELRPGHISVGPREVERRRKAFLALSPSERDAFLEKKIAGIVIGPTGTLYLSDGHHLVAALRAAGQTTVLARVRENLFWDSRQEFARDMVKKGYAVLRDTQADQQLHFLQLPRSIAALGEDDYRDLYWSLLREGDIAEGPPDQESFTEFLWAKYLRDRIPPEDVRANYEKAVLRARQLSHDAQARAIPGYRKTKKPRIGKSDPGL